MIDVKTLKELVRLMVDNDLSELDLRDREETVTLRRGGSGAPVVYASPAPVLGAAPSAHAGSGAAPAPAADPSAGLTAIESPMVGTFYSASDPDSPPFLSAGKSVRKDDVVCLIEAMKVFNEIKSEVNGVVEKVLVENGKPVEFGQKLFLVRPA